MVFEAFKIGSVSSVNPKKATARVYFPDDDGMVSYDLQVLQPTSFGNKDYSMPDVGADVVCGFLSSGSEEGFILGAVYSDGNPPPESTMDKRTVVFKDGTRIVYDRATHELTVTIGGTRIVANRTNVNVFCDTALISATQGVEIDTPATHITGTLTVDKLITGSGGLAISGGSGASVTGSLTTTGDVTAGGISLQGHTHTEQGDGSETSTAH